MWARASWLAQGLELRRRWPLGVVTLQGLEVSFEVLSGRGSGPHRSITTSAAFERWGSAWRCHATQEQCYKEAVEAAQLEVDLQNLPAGEETEIGAMLGAVKVCG